MVIGWGKGVVNRWQKKSEGTKSCYSLIYLNRPKTLTSHYQSNLTVNIQPLYISTKGNAI